MEDADRARRRLRAVLGVHMPAGAELGHPIALLDQAAAEPRTELGSDVRREGRSARDDRANTAEVEVVDPRLPGQPQDERWDQRQPGRLSRSWIRCSALLSMAPEPIGKLAARKTGYCIRA